jgi:hypothetical protein
MKMLLEAADLSTIESLKKAISRGQVAGIRPNDIPADKMLEKVLLSLKDVDKKYRNASIVLALNKLKREYLVAKRKFNPKAYELYFQHKNNKNIAVNLNDFEKGIMTDTEFIREVEKEVKGVTEKDVTKLYEDDEWVLVHPKTYFAACKYGKNTKWCTTMNSSTFRQYSGLLIIINKKTNEKYQTDPNTNMFNDEKDSNLQNFQHKKILDLYKRFPIEIKKILFNKRIRTDQKAIYYFIAQNKLTENYLLRELKQIYNFNQSNKDEILHMAISKNYYNIAKYMIEKGANVNAHGGVLLYAYGQNNLEMFKLLLDNGANIGELSNYKIKRNDENKEVKKEMLKLLKQHSLGDVMPDSILKNKRKNKWHM